MHSSKEINRLVGLGVLAAFLSGCASAPPRTPDPLPQTFEEQRSAASGTLSGFLTRTGAPSIQAALVDSNGTLWSESRGVAQSGSNSPADSSTVYRLASLSKVFTALAIYQLAVQGKIDLDSGVGKVIPEFKVNCIGNQCAPITVRELLTHSSGLPRGEIFVWHPLSGKPLLEKLAQVRPVYPPATRFSYSNLGYALLGEIVARVSQKDFRTFVTEEILNPLGMHATGFAPLDTLIPNRAIGFSVPGMHPLVQPLSDAEGGMYSTLSDLTRFTAWLLAGARLPIHGAPGVAMLDSLVAPFHPAMELPEDAFCGFGRMRINHGRRTPFKTGFMDGFASGIFLDVEKRVGVIALTNRDRELDQVGLAILNLFTGTGEAFTGLSKDSVSGFSRANSVKELAAFEGDYILGIDYPVPIATLQKTSNGLQARFENKTIYSSGIDEGWARLRFTQKWDRQWLFFKNEYEVSTPRLGFFSKGAKRYIARQDNTGVHIGAETPESGGEFLPDWEKRIGVWEDGSGYELEIFKQAGLIFFTDNRINRTWQLEPVTANYATAGGPSRIQGLNLDIQKDGSIDYRMGIHLNKRPAK